ncbi:MAG: class I SAM-dependent methyltransferase [Prochloraceae cyanobacterium]
MNHERSSEEIIKKVRLLADRAIANSQPTAWFERLYSEAKGNENHVPWAKSRPHPYLVNWLTKSKKNGNRNYSAIVIGCGLGDDAEAIAKCGYEVTAFDISATAIDWCNKRFPDSEVNYLVADLLSLDPAWYGKFDFVFESRTIQALPIYLRSDLTAAIAKLVADRGTLLVITRYRDTSFEPDGPPWPLSELELSEFKQLGLLEVSRDLFFEPGTESIKQLRIEYIKDNK